MDFAVRLNNGTTSRWLNVPATKDDLQYALNEMTKDGGSEKFEIDRFRDGDFNGALSEKIEKYIIGADINTVNYLAVRFTEIDPNYLEWLPDIMELNFSRWDIEWLLDYTFNPNYYDFVSNVTNDNELRNYLEEVRPEKWEKALDKLHYDFVLTWSAYKDDGGAYYRTGLEWNSPFKNTKYIPPEHIIHTDSTNPLLKTEQAHIPTETVGGYAIKNYVVFSNNKGFAVGENLKEAESFVTWQLTEENGKRDYYWGHYFKKSDDCTSDFYNRVCHYMHYNNVDVKYNYIEPSEKILEQNENMIDGIINNTSSPKADLTDGQTYDEIKELIPESLEEQKHSSALSDLNKRLIEIVDAVAEELTADTNEKSEKSFVDLHDLDAEFGIDFMRNGILLNVVVDMLCERPEIEDVILDKNQLTVSPKINDDKLNEKNKASVLRKLKKRETDSPGISKLKTGKKKDNYER